MRLLLLVFLRPVCMLQAEDMLREAGAEMCEAPPMIPRVTRHREVITAQGPTSVDAFGKALVAALEGDETHKFE